MGEITLMAMLMAGGQCHLFKPLSNGPRRTLYYELISPYCICDYEVPRVFSSFFFFWHVTHYLSDLDTYVLITYM